MSGRSSNDEKAAGSANGGRADLPQSPSDKTAIHKDAEGQFAPSQGDRESNGVASAIPTNVTGEEDATMYNAEKTSRPKAGFNEREQTNKRD